MPDSWIKKLIPDRMTTLLIAVVVMASVFPAQGWLFNHLQVTSTWIVALLFFLHGARLSPHAVLQGLTHWRLHGVVLSITYLIFPLVALALGVFKVFGLSEAFYIGFVFLSVLPSTVQSSIGFTSIAQGNVAAAVCSAALSNVVGVLITPLLVAILLSGNGGASLGWETFTKIAMQLLLPFVLGQIARPWIGKFLLAHPSWVKFFDQGSILMVVYVAFCQSVNEGLWQSLPWLNLIALTGISSVFLAIMLLVSQLLGKKLGFSPADQRVILFCGSKKSLASGVPMAKILITSSQLGTVLLPLMIFHQIQLMVCAVIAQRYAKLADSNNPIH